MKRTDEFHHNTEEVSTYCRVIYVVLVRPKVTDEDWSHNMLPVSYTTTWEHLVELSLKLLKVENSPWGGGGGKFSCHFQGQIMSSVISKNVLKYWKKKKNQDGSSQEPSHPHCAQL